MGKKFISLLLTLLLLLLCGCDGNSSPLETKNAETMPQLQEVPAVEDVAYQIPAYDKGQLLIPHDTDWQVYIPFYNQDMDYYPDYWFTGITGFILTKEHYSIDEIQIEIPVQTQYKIVIDDLTVVPEGSSGPPTLYNYQYLCRQGIDWREYGQLEMNANVANTILGEYFFELAKAKNLDKYQAYEDKFAEKRDLYQAQYDSRQHEDNPFSVYCVSIYFTGIGTYEETVESIDFTFGSETYTVDIGQWRFHKERPSELTKASALPGMKQENVVVTAVVDSPYNGGYVLLNNALSFTATEDITITGVRQLGVEVGLLGARVVLSGSTNADFYWDLQRPLEIEEGDAVNISLYLKDDRFAEYEVGITTYFILDYEVNGKSYNMCLPCLLSRLNNKAWDVYLMAAEGYDMGEYYNCYFVPLVESWIRDLPEEWRQ